MATAVHRLVLADDALVQALSMCTSFSISPSSRRLTGIPVQLATTSAMSSARDLLLQHGEPACSSSQLALAASSSRSSSGSSP